MGRTAVQRLGMTQRGGRLAAYMRALTSRARSDGDSLTSLRDHLEPRLRAVVADALGVEPEDLTPDTSLVHDLAADSLDLLDVVVCVEEAFDVSFPEREIAAIATFGDLAATTAALVACRRRAEANVPQAGRVELRVGAGEVPRFLRVLSTDPYDRELLRDDVRRADAEPVRVSRVGESGETPSLDRALLSASLAGADVGGAEPRDAGRSGGRDADERNWPARRLVVTSLALVDLLHAERDASLRALEGRAALAEDVAEQRRRTDDRVVAFRAVVATYVDVLGDARTILHAAGRELARLDVVRRAVDERRIDEGEARAAYDSIADALLCYVHALQSAEAWTRTRLPPRGITTRSPGGQIEELRA